MIAWDLHVLETTTDPLPELGVSVCPKTMAYVGIRVAPCHLLEWAPFLPIIVQIALDKGLFWPKLQLPRFNDLTIQP